MLIGKPTRDNDPVFFPEPYWDIFLICHIVSVLPVMPMGQRIVCYAASLTAMPAAFFKGFIM